MRSKTLVWDCFSSSVEIETNLGGEVDLVSQSDSDMEIREYGHECNGMNRMTADDRRL